jgi:hypothetical protein
MEIPQLIKICPGNHRVGWCRSCLGNLKWKRTPRSTVSLKMLERISHAWHGHRLKRKRKYSRYRPAPVLRSDGIQTVPSMVLFVCLFARLGLKRNTQPITATSEEVILIPVLDTSSSFHWFLEEQRSKMLGNCLTIVACNNTEMLYNRGPQIFQ